MSDGDLDQRVLAHLKAGDTKQAVTETLRRLGPEVFGFLLGVLGDDDDADEVFSALSERLWQSLSKFQGYPALRFRCR